MDPIIETVRNIGDYIRKDNTVVVDTAALTGRRHTGAGIPKDAENTDFAVALEDIPPDQTGKVRFLLLK